MSENKQLSREINARAKKTFIHRSIKSYFPNYLWSADLVDVSNQANYNNKIRFLSVIIDVYSRKAFVSPLRNKEGPTLAKTFRELYEKVGAPWNLFVDQGSEYFNMHMALLHREYLVNMYHTQSDVKSAFVERFNRTLRARLRDKMSEFRTKKYINFLPEVVSEYNETIHSSTNKVPNQLYTEPINPAPREKPDINETKFHEIGDFVRIQLKKRSFAKEAEQTWSYELYRVRAIHPGGKKEPTLYEIEDLLGEDITGKFHYSQLLKSKFTRNVFLFEKIKQTKTVNRKKKFLVTFEGLPAKFDKWVTQQELNELKKR